MIDLHGLPDYNDVQQYLGLNYLGLIGHDSMTRLSRLRSVTVHFLRSFCLPFCLLALLSTNPSVAFSAGGTQATSSQGSGPPQYSIRLLGFEDEVHTFPGNFRRSSVRGVFGDGTSTGGLIGSSSRFTTDTAGATGWLFTRDDQQIRPIGLLDSEFFISPRQSHRTRPWSVNELGQAVGTTSTNPTSSSGKNLGWFFDPRTGETIRIGASTLLNPPALTNDNPRFFQPDGFAVGTSQTGTSGASQQAWSFDPDDGLTREIGLPESTDLGPDARLISQTVEAITSTNLVIGTSFRNPTPSGSFHGEAVWVHNPNDLTTKRVGFFGSAYTLNNGDKISKFDGVNANNLVVGRSFFSTVFSGGSSAWLYDPIADTTTSIGLANPSGGEQFNDFVTAITASNFVVGGSNSQNSKKSWIYDHSSGTTMNLGLYDAEHTLSNGGTDNQVVAHTEAGYVLGESERGAGDTRSSFNVTPWIYNPNSGEIQQAGLTEGDYTTPGDGRWASALQINRSGQAIGYSRLFAGNPSSVRRDSPWFFDPKSGETIELARTLAIERNTVFIGPLRLNDRGQVAGISTNNSGGGDFVWFYDQQTGTTVTDFDIRDEFTFRPTRGGAEVSILELTDSGLVLGSSGRHQTNGADAGNTLWLYDSDLDVTHELVFSTSGRGEAFTNVAYMSESGVLFGEYDAYDEAALLSERRYFYWSLDYGFSDLESLIVGDLTDEGWDTIVRSLDFSGDLKIIDESFLTGRGLRVDGSSMPFALIQVPEPTAGLLFATATLLVAGGKRNWFRRR